MRKVYFLLLTMLTMFFFLPTNAQTQDTVLTVNNYSFELPSIGSGNFSAVKPTGWQRNYISGYTVGILGEDRANASNTPEGVQWVHMQGYGCAIGQLVRASYEYHTDTFLVSWYATRRLNETKQMTHMVKLVVNNSDTSFVNGTAIDSFKYDTDLPNQTDGVYADIANIKLHCSGYNVSMGNRLWIVFENRVPNDATTSPYKQLEIDNVRVKRRVPVAKTLQTISFGSLPNKVFGDSNFDLTATASSGLAVTYTSSNTAVAAISGSTVTIVGTGVTTITASQAGNETYATAADVTQSLAVDKAGQTITFSDLAAVKVGDPAFNLNATSSSGLGVTFSSSNTAVASVNGTKVSIISAGTATITASQAGNNNYNAAVDVQKVLTVNPMTGVTDTIISLINGGFEDPDIAVDGFQQGNPTGWLWNNAGTKVGLLGEQRANVTDTPDGDQWAMVQGTGSQLGQMINKAYKLAIDTFVVSYYAARRTNEGTNITHKVKLIISDSETTYVGGTVLDEKTYSTPLPNNLESTFADTIFKLAPGANYTSGLGNKLWIVFENDATGTDPQLLIDNVRAIRRVYGEINTKSNQSITFAAITDKTFGDGTFDIIATSSSGLPVSLESSDPNVVTISGKTATIIGAGSATIIASQAGDANFEAALSVIQTFTVSKANQTITFDALTSKKVGDAPFSLLATSTSGLPVTFTSDNTSVATVNGSAVTIVAAGTANIIAHQAGNNNYNAASDLSRALTVTSTTSVGSITEKDVIIAPNPVVDILRITLVNSGNADIHIYTLSGNLIHSVKFSGSSVSIDISHFSAGSYIVKVYTLEGIITKKIVKE